MRSCRSRYSGHDCLDTIRCRRAASTSCTPQASTMPGIGCSDHRLDPREHRGVHADPDAKRHDHHGRQARHPPDHPPRLPQVAHHIRHSPLDLPDFARMPRPENSRDSLCTLIFSPSLMNSGTRISMPVSSVATLVTLPLAVSPRAPASVDATVISTCGGEHEPDRLVVVGVDLNQRGCPPAGTCRRRRMAGGSVIVSNVCWSMKL